jgi:hypothetical protein
MNGVPAAVGRLATVDPWLADFAQRHPAELLVMLMEDGRVTEDVALGVQRLSIGDATQPSKATAEDATLEAKADIPPVQQEAKPQIEQTANHFRATQSEQQKEDEEMEMVVGWLRKSPEFQNVRQHLQQNPEQLPIVIQNLRSVNKQVARLIERDEQLFVRLVMTDEGAATYVEPAKTSSAKGKSAGAELAEKDNTPACNDAEDGAKPPATSHPPTSTATSKPDDATTATTSQPAAPPRPRPIEPEPPGRKVVFTYRINSLIYLGLGPACMQRGDTLAVFKGHNITMLLRALPDGKYLIVGPCYRETEVNSTTHWVESRQQWFEIV